VTERAQRISEVVIVAGLSLLAMALAWSRSWVCDDAFITLRYAENLANGLGAVYNAGEHVEGYSNPSWMLLASLAIRVGLDPVAFVQWLGILCYGALVPVTWLVGRRLVPGDRAFLPLAALGVALHQHLQDFASCGLETLGFVLLVTLTAFVLLGADRPRKWAIVSVLTVLATLTRPDGVVLGGAVALLVIVYSARRRSLGPVLAFAAPGFLLLLPFLAWRFIYYGDVLPNTFYAKSAHDPYPGQGWFYVRLFLDAYYVLWPAAVALPVMLLLGRRVFAMPVIATLALCYLAFVIWVGGDFMFARFCLPVTPLLYLALESLTRRYVPGLGRWLVLVVVAAGTVFFYKRPDLYVVGEAVQGVADERAQYPPERANWIRAVGGRLGDMLDGTDVRVAFSGTQAMLIWESKVPYALEAVTGLTDHFLAHREVQQRGHVGHEKGIFSSAETIEYALRTQGVHLFLFDWPEQTAMFPWLTVEVDGWKFTLARWDREIMARLIGQPGVVATDVEQFLDDYLRDLDSKSKAEVGALLSALDLVYFRWNDDPARRGRLVAYLAR